MSAPTPPSSGSFASLSKIPDTPGWRFPTIQPNAGGHLVTPAWVADLFPSPAEANQPSQFIDRHSTQTVNEPWNTFVINDAPLPTVGRPDEAAKAIYDLYTVMKLKEMIQKPASRQAL